MLYNTSAEVGNKSKVNKSLMNFFDQPLFMQHQNKSVITDIFHFFPH